MMEWSAELKAALRALSDAQAAADWWRAQAAELEKQLKAAKEGTAETGNDEPAE